MDKWDKFKYTPGSIPSTRYKCDKCAHEWRPRDTAPGSVIFCPKCGSFHSKRSMFLKPPNPKHYLTYSKAVKAKKSKPLKPPEKKQYVETGIDQYSKR